MRPEDHDLEAFNSASELGFFEFKNFLIWMYLVHFPRVQLSILFLFIFGHKIGVVKSPALFQGKELQVTCFQVMSF